MSGYESDYYSMFENFRNKHGSKIPSTWIELDWIDSWDFETESKMEESHNLNTFRRYFLASVSKMVSDSNISGHTIEFGVFNGYGSLLIMKNSKRFHYMVDSFLGVSEPDFRDGLHWKKGDMARNAMSVRNNLKEFEGRFALVEGFLPEVTIKIPNIPIAFAHVDVDLYIPTKSSLNWLANSISNGGFILCDDYGFATCPGATQACQEFIAENPSFNLLPLPAGGGLIFQHGT